MRTYLERLAATAISPGDALHPLAGTLYARPTDTSVPASASPNAEPFQIPAYPTSGNREPEAPLSEQEPQTRPAGEASRSESSFLSIVEPKAFPPASSSFFEAALQPVLPRQSLPQEPLPEEKTLDTPFVPLISPFSASPSQSTDQPTRQSSDGPVDRPLDRPRFQTDAPAHSQPEPREHVSQSLSSAPSKIHQPEPGNGAEPVRSSDSFESKPVLQRQRSPQLSVPSSDPATVPHTRISADAEPAPTPAEAQPGSPIAHTPAAPPAQPASPIAGTPAAPPAQPASPIAHSPAAPPAQPASADPPTYRPLVHGYAQLAPVSSARTPLNPRPQGPLAGTPRQPQPREPDEIQIHIGRIEVTAVQPAPAARPQPPSLRRTPSLDDYLRRGNGRA